MFMKKVLLFYCIVIMTFSLFVGCSETDADWDFEDLFSDMTYSGVEVGEYITFGKYEQDNNESNGREDIEWLVLDKEDSRVLVISKYGLDARSYHSTKTTWEKSKIREWLNDDFIDSAFTDKEKKQIPTITVSADENSNYSTSPGNATEDQIFLLSIVEAEKYFESDEERMCKPTKYALNEGAYDNEGICCWWLRTPGVYQIAASYVNSGGGVFEHGTEVYNDSRAIRPAMWIDLNS